MNFLLNDLVFVINGTVNFFSMWIVMFAGVAFSLFMLIFPVFFLFNGMGWLGLSLGLVSFLYFSFLKRFFTGG